MSKSIYLSLIIMALTIYAIRLFPFLVIRKPIRNKFIKSFLYYVPYVTLAVMTFPAILTATGNLFAGAMALVVGLIVAWIWGDLFAVAISCCVVAFAMGMIL